LTPAENLSFFNGDIWRQFSLSLPFWIEVSIVHVQYTRPVAQFDIVNRWQWVGSNIVLNNKWGSILNGGCGICCPSLATPQILTTRLFRHHCQTKKILARNVFLFARFLSI
jgi:hypothetical protein